MPEIEPIARPAPEKILFVANNLWFISHHRIGLLRKLMQQGTRVHVIATGSEEEKAKLQAQGVTVHLIEVNFYSVNLLDMKNIRRIRMLIEELQPEIIHAFTIKGIVYAKLACLRANLPVKPGMLYSFAGLGRLFSKNSSVFFATARRILKSVLVFKSASLKQAITTETLADKQSLVSRLGLDGSRIYKVNGAGVDFELFKPQPLSGPVTFLFASRLLKAKGAEVFVDAARLLLEEGTTARFLIAGFNDPRDPDAVDPASLEWLNSRDNTQFLGNVPIEEMPQTIADCDVACLPSTYNEGIPRVLLEACATGKTFISTRIAGVEELMGRDESCGWYLDEASPRQLADKMKEAAANPQLCRQKGADARQKLLASKVEESDVFAQFIDIYRSLTA